MSSLLYLESGCRTPLLEFQSSHTARVVPSRCPQAVTLKIHSNSVMYSRFYVWFCDFFVCFVYFHVQVFLGEIYIVIYEIENCLCETFPLRDVSGLFVTTFIRG